MPVAVPGSGTRTIKMLRLLQGPEVLGEQGWFGQDSRAGERLDAFAMAPGVEGPALAPLASDPGMDWVRTCRS